MRFHPSQEQELLQDSIRRLLADVIPHGQRQAQLDATSDFDPGVWNALMELGLAGLLVSPEQGGSGLGLTDAALAAETLGSGGAPGPIVPHMLATYAVAEAAPGFIRDKWLAKLLSGRARATIAFDDTWLPDAWQTASPSDCAFAFVPGADVADLFIVGLSGRRLAIVERDNADVVVTTMQSADRTRRLSAVNLKAPEATEIGDSALAIKLFDAALVLLAADAFGGAQRCLSMTVDYVQTRQQFGVALAQFQAIKHQLADMAVELEPARALVWYAALALDEDLADASRRASLAKAHLADRFTSITRAAVLAHGGIGYTWEYDLQVWFRRALYDHAFLGNPSLHRERAADLADWAQ
jgi:alkylation response protein AidB-like acyl-CoA dehydrogenase